MPNSLCFKSILLLISLFNCIEQFTCTPYETLNQIGPVVFVNVLFRHGDRTPISFYPNDPYKNLSYWPEGLGQLTNEGKERHYTLGKWMKQRYKSLIGELYERDNLHAQSTDVDRCLMSAELNLAGMFPPKKAQIWSQSLRWQPIPVHTIPAKEDKVLAMQYPCQKFELELEKAQNEGQLKEWNLKYKGLKDYLSLHTGAEVKNLTLVEYIYSTLSIEEKRNLTLPEWTKPVYPEPMRTVAALSFAAPTINKILKRLHTGPLLKEIIEHFEEKRDGKLDPDRKMWIYSAHDSTLSSLLNTMGVYNFLEVPFAAAVLLELRKSKNDYFVTLLYKNETDREPYLLEIPSCTVACPLKKFRTLYEDLLPVNWDAECHLHYFFDFTSDLPYNTLAIFAMVTSILLVFILFAATSLLWQRQSEPVYRKLPMDAI